MSLDSGNVRVAITGEVYRAPLGTARPADSTDALNAAYVGLGYISDEGVTETPDETVERVVAWQGAVVVRSTTTEATATLAFTMIETKAATLETYHKGSAVVDLGGGEYKLDVVPPTEDRKQYVFDVIDGDKHLRFDCPDAEVTERGEIVYATAEAIAYPVTVTCYPTNGVLYTKYSDDAAWDPS